MKDIIRGSVFRVLYMGFNFGVGLLIAHLSGATLFGTISLLMVNAGIFHIITGLGTDSSILWHGSKDKMNSGQLHSFAYVVMLFQILVFLGMSLAWYQMKGRNILTGLNDQHTFLFELLYMIGLVMLDKYLALAYANQLAVPANKILASVMACTIIGLGLIYFDLLPIKLNPLFIFCLLPLIQVIPLFIYYHVKITLELAPPHRKFLRSLFNFSLIVFFTNAIQFLAYRVDYWMIDIFYSNTEVGIYAQANRFAQLMWVIPNIVAALLVPALAASTPSLNNSGFLSIIRVLTVLSILILIGVIFIAILLYTYFLPVEFFDGFTVLILMLPGFYLFVLNILLAAWFSAQRKLWINFKGSLLCFGVVLGADLLFIPAFSIEGAALANTIAYSLSALYLINNFIKHSQTPFKEILDLKRSDWKLFFNHTH